ncbi:hypothetical protein GX48_07750, partial [Paracoccidioides brasiliensis]
LWRTSDVKSQIDTDMDLVDLPEQQSVEVVEQKLHDATKKQKAAFRSEEGN